MKNVKLYNGDCLEVMKKNISDNSIDLTVTSPPYDNLRTYNGNIDQWSFEKFQAIAKELYRITKEGGVVVWVVSDATINGSETGTSFKQALYFKECGFNLLDTMIYQKQPQGAKGNNKIYWQTFEYMFVFSKGNAKTINLIKDRENKYLDKNHSTTIRQKNGLLKKSHCTIQKYGRRTNVWYYLTGKGHSTNDNYAFNHPAVFPEQLANDHILSWSNKGDVVFDCFLGSGTTGKMAILNDRKFIGIELDKGYYDIAEKRINNAIIERNSRLF